MTELSLRVSAKNPPSGFGCRFSLETISDEDAITPFSFFFHPRFRLYIYIYREREKEGRR